MTTSSLKRKNRGLDLYEFQRPNIIVVGDKSVKKSLREIEKNFNVQFIFGELKEIKLIINSQTLCLIVDEKKIGMRVKQKMLSFLKITKNLPTYFLSRKSRGASFFTSLYGNGLHGAFKWPKESFVFYELLIQTLKPLEHISGKKESDIRLAKIVKAHLFLMNFNKKIEVFVSQTKVYLKGEVKNLYQKNELENEVFKILGVQSVDTSAIKIKYKANISDNEIKRKLKLYMSNLLGRQKKSILVKVKNQNVTIQGVVSDGGYINDIEEFACKQPGVQQVKKEVTKNPKEVVKNVRMAKKTEKKIIHLFDGVKHISINLFGDNAEISGVVKTYAVRELIKKYVLQSLPVKRVINKLFVTPPKV